MIYQFKLTDQDGYVSLHRTMADTLAAAYDLVRNMFPLCVIKACSDAEAEQFTRRCLASGQFRNERYLERVRARKRRSRKPDKGRKFG